MHKPPFSFSIWRRRFCRRQ